MTAHRFAMWNSAPNSGRAFVAMPVLVPSVLAIAMLAAGSPTEARVAAHGLKPVAMTPNLASPASPGEGDKVAQALARGDIASAQNLAEAAVVANPRAAGLRVVLGRVYLRAGRFESAASMLADARALGDMGGRTALGLALAQIATGRGSDAVAVLDAAHETIPVSDYGLALAMAGAAPRGVAILGDALRAGDQSPKLRQNLAYAFALNGRWGEARMMAAFDTPADKLDGRMAQWAETAQPDAVRLRVANLIGVPLRNDPGVPLSLALAPQAAVTVADNAASATTQVATRDEAKAETKMDGAVKLALASGASATAEATGPLPAGDQARSETAKSDVASAPESAPAPVLAEAAPVPNPAQASQPASQPVPDRLVLHRADTTHLVGVALSHADVVAARHARIQARHHGAAHLAKGAPVDAGVHADAPQASAPAQVAALPEHADAPAAPAVKLAVAVPNVKSAKRAQKINAQKAGTQKTVDVAMAAPEVAPAPTPSGAATHIVQLGSFSSQQNAEHARQTFLARDPALGHRQFVITQAVVKGRNFWRVAVMGFDANSAGQTCGAIRHHGGACFAYAAGHLPGGQGLAQGLALATPQKDHLARR